MNESASEFYTRFLEPRLTWEIPKALGHACPQLICSLIYSLLNYFTHPSAIQQVFIAQLKYNKHYARCWGYNGEQDRYGLCLQGDDLGFSYASRSGVIKGEGT